MNALSQTGLLHFLLDFILSWAGSTSQREDFGGKVSGFQSLLWHMLTETTPSLSIKKKKEYLSHKVWGW